MTLETLISIIVSIVTATAAIIALALTRHDTVISNKQFLYEKRTYVWSVIRHLLISYRSNRSDLKFPNGYFSTDFSYALLCNNIILEGIQGAARDLGSEDTQRRFLFKMDELRFLSEKIPFLFRGYQTEAMSEFLIAYVNVLDGLRRCQIWLKSNSESIQDVPGYKMTLEEEKAELLQVVKSCHLHENIDALEKNSIIMDDGYWKRIRKAISL